MGDAREKARWLRGGVRCVWFAPPPRVVALARCYPLSPISRGDHKREIAAAAAGGATRTCVFVEIGGGGGGADFVIIIANAVSLALLMGILYFKLRDRASPA
jgi:hypothetical protein